MLKALDKLTKFANLQPKRVFLQHKTLDNIVNCQRPVFSLVCIPPYMQKITNLWKFELSRSSKLRDNNERKEHTCHTKLCAFRCLISRPQNLIPRSQNQFRGKLLLSPKLRYFRGSHFSQCFILRVITNRVHCLLKTLDTHGKLSKISLLTWCICISTCYVQNNK